MNTNVLLCLLVISVSEVLSAPSLRGQCMVRPSLRIECGHSGITRYRCHKQGCCYDNSVRGAIACFESQSNITPLGQVPVATLRVVHDQATDDVFSPQPRVQNPDQSTMRTCSAAPLDRIECGWSSITRQACESRGCCFDRSSRGSPWCFKADSLLISQKMKTVLECAWECSRKSWRSIAAGYSKCATNAACWMMLVGQTPGACVAACKTTYEIGVFKSNVSTCLGLETAVARVASEQCDTDLPCWIDRFGYRALNCFRRYQATGQSFTIEYPEAEEEMILPHEEVENTIAPSRAPPMIEREEESASTPEIEPEAPQETPQPPQGEGELIRTNLSVEISSSGITENRSSLDDVPSEEDTRIPEERIEEENS